MKIKNVMIFLSIFIILIGIKKYVPKRNYIPYKEKNVEVSKSREEEKDFIINSTNEDKYIEKTEPVFCYSLLSEEIIQKIIGKSYKENNFINIEDLTYIQVTYWGFDDKEHVGEMIVNIDAAEKVVEIFKELHKAKFPIEKIRLIDNYKADDNLSMADNNTSAFCYREIAGSKGSLSNHSYGLAIDINPVQNPYVKNNIILPEEGKEYLDRKNIKKGMIVEGDACYKAFKNRGWTWGGDWKALKDYQHFELPNKPLY